MNARKKRTPEKRARRLDPEDKRDRILAAAFRLFSRDGYEAVAISAIVREADVAQGTLYRYFPGKSDLLEALMGQMDFAIVEAISPVLDSGSVHLPLEDFFRGLMEAGNKALQPYQPLMSALQAEALWFGSSTQAQLRRAPQLQQLTEILRQRQMLGEVSTHLPAELAMILVDNVLNGVARSVLLRHAEGQSEDFLRLAAHFLARGLAP